MFDLLFVIFFLIGLIFFRKIHDATTTTFFLFLHSPFSTDPYIKRSNFFSQERERERERASTQILTKMIMCYHYYCYCCSQDSSPSTSSFNFYTHILFGGFVSRKIRVLYDPKRERERVESRDFSKNMRILLFTLLTILNLTSSLKQSWFMRGNGNHHRGSRNDVVGPQTSPVSVIFSLSHIALVSHKK